MRWFIFRPIVAVAVLSGVWACQDLRRGVAPYGPSQLTPGGSGGNAGNGQGEATPITFNVDGGLASLLDGGCLTAVNCASQGVGCGPLPDGCGGVLQCGTCTAPETCGGGGVPSVCGGAGACVPKTCEGLGATCGAAGDGCGNEIQCGDCSAPQTCGGGGVPSTCGSIATCAPATCAGLGATCGAAGDGCGSVLQCGNCTPPATCGGGGVPSVCGAPLCTPKACLPGVHCGPMADGCGHLLQCGECTLPATCGGDGRPSVCGVRATCTNLCLQQVACPANGTTTVTGVVYAPGHASDPPPPAPGSADPLFNVLVYIPNAPVALFQPGVACDRCDASVSGSPLVSTFTDTDGSFTLKNVPVGQNIPLVIQSGRWRRQVVIPTVTACTDTVLSPSLTRLPRNQQEGDIPHMAFATGAVDTLECVLRKIGVDDTEFTQPSGNGRIHLYVGAGSAGANAGWGTDGEAALWGSPATLGKYDMVLFPCQGARFGKSRTAQRNLINYASAGGRVFATHFSYVWLYNDPPFSGTANWRVDQTYPGDQTATIDTSFPKGQALAAWLSKVGATSTLGEIPVSVIRDDVRGVIAPSQSWLSLSTPPVTLHYTFNTPVGAAPDQQCGRVLFDDFHVEDASNHQSTGKVFPTECDDGPMTPQEKLLEFMLFDLGSCITPDIPSCTKATCNSLGIQCGPAGDGCGGTLDCGPCPTGQTCGGGGEPSVCGVPHCVPRTCGDQGTYCGPAGDGCGGLLACGPCPTGQTCGGGGKPGVCGGATCTPSTCTALGVHCGPAGDGCGGLLACGPCPTGQTCGGGGPGLCGAATCTPNTCASLGATCGPVADGCGGLVECGTCSPPQSCGGGGKPNVCGGGIH